MGRGSKRWGLVVYTVYTVWEIGATVPREEELDMDMACTAQINILGLFMF